ncbi:MAG: hypothetical protein ACO3QO_05675, partial [Candidatus Kapaibacteriota bacterium]
MIPLILLALTCTVASAQYIGTGSVSQGVATTTIPTVFSCPGGRPTALGQITASDGSSWIVPADVRFLEEAYPFASVLYDQCSKATYRTTSEALSHLDGSDVIVIDADGELITGFIFADNYFELWVNGQFVGKDNVPFTPFNSNIVRFRVRRPFTIAMLLVDWEEHLGLGTENNAGVSFHPGDGGMVALFRNESEDVVAVTNASWRAQTFYSSPIKDLSCPSEIGTVRSTADCNTDGTDNGSQYYAIYWPIPDGWTLQEFDDSAWPAASTYANTQIGVNNKPAYMNFTDVFDDPNYDAQFIWSTNVVLDNCVIVRYTVDKLTSIRDVNSAGKSPCTYVYDMMGTLIWHGATSNLDTTSL